MNLFLGINCSDKILVDVMELFAEFYGEWNEYYGYDLKAQDAVEDEEAILFVYKIYIIELCIFYKHYVYDIHKQNT